MYCNKWILNQNLKVWEETLELNLLQKGHKECLFFQLLQRKGVFNTKKKK